MKEIKIPKELKDFAIFVAEDDIEIMTSALSDEDFDKENKRMNLVAIKRLRKAINKIREDKPLTWVERVQLIEANEIHLNDGKPQARKLNIILSKK